MILETSDVELYDYYVSLCEHDWSYEYSDDWGRWSRGKEDWDRLRAIRGKGGEYLKLWNAFIEYQVAGRPEELKPEVIYREEG